MRLLGARRDDEVAQLLAEASVFLQPSVVAPDGQMDGIPVALMEAMASGLPVVASALSGIPELVEHERSGLLVSPGDAAALGAALQQLIENPDLGRRLGERGRVRVENDFELSRCVAQLGARLAAESLPPEPAWERRLARLGWPELAGGPIGLRRQHESRDSRVAELLLPGAPRPRELVLKLHKEFAGQSSPARERAGREAEALRNLREHFDGPGAAPGAGYGVPHLLRLRCLCVCRPGRKTAPYRGRMGKGGPGIRREKISVGK